MSINIVDSSFDLLRTYENTLSGGACFGNMCGSKQNKETKRPPPREETISMDMIELDEPFEEVEPERNTLERALQGVHERLTGLMELSEGDKKKERNYNIQVTFLNMLKDTLTILNESGIDDIDTFKNQIDKVEKAIPIVIRMKNNLEKIAREKEDNLSDNVKMIMEEKYELVTETLDNLETQKESLKNKCGIPCSDDNFDESALEEEYNSLVGGKRSIKKNPLSGGLDTGDFKEVGKQLLYQPLKIGEEGLKVGQEGLKVGQEGLKVGQEGLKVGQEGLKFTGQTFGTAGNILEEAGQGTGKMFGAITTAASAPINRFGKWQERVTERNNMKEEAGREWNEKIAELSAKKKYMKKLDRYEESIRKREKKKMKREQKEMAREQKKIAREQKKMAREQKR
tara:strand:+ start:17015 stop:18211 length:1197 start_codon:yes stop_codon:yes gene_type:complete